MAALCAMLLVSGIVWHVDGLSVDDACKHAQENALPKSKCCCAWFVMRALQAGGCPMVIAPAWSYKYVLPLYGFERVPLEGYKPKRGDICVIEASKEHFWGHISLYDGKIWISDFKQKNMNPYRKSYPYVVFRVGE